MELKIVVFDSRDISLDSLLNSKYLSSLEKTSFDKYKVLEVKKEKIASTILKNKYVGDYYLNEYGKPLSNNCYFNISHSHGYVVFAMDKVPVGIDVEIIKPANKELIDYISNDEEKKYIHDDQSFFEIWTNKEALVKALGVGLKVKPNEIVSLPMNGRRIYQGNVYSNKTIKYDNCIITVSRQIDDDFDLKIIKENI